MALSLGLSFSSWILVDTFFQIFYNFTDEDESMKSDSEENRDEDSDEAADKQEGDYLGKKRQGRSYQR